MTASPLEVSGHLRHARIPLDPRPGHYLVVGDDEIEPAVAEVLSRTEAGELRLRMLPGPASVHPQLHALDSQPRLENWLPPNAEHHDR